MPLAAIVANFLNDYEEGDEEVFPRREESNVTATRQEGNLK